MGISVVGLDAQSIEIFHHIHFYTPVGSVAIVARHVEGLLSYRSHAIFNGVVDILVEQTHHELLTLLWKIFIAQVEVVCNRMLEVGISTFVVVFVDDVVGHYLKKAWPIDGLIIGQSKVGVFVNIPFDVCIRKPVGILLVAIVAVALCGIHQVVALVGVFGPHSRYYLPFAGRKGDFAVCRTDFFGGIIVHGVCQTVAFQAEQDFIVIIPVCSPELVV